MTYHHEQEEIEKAEKAIEEARRSSSVTDRLVREAQEALAETRRWREDNHFGAKIRDIIRGAR